MSMVMYCIHGDDAGREIREKLDEHVAQLYFDLDGGFSHLAWLLPSWLPLPSFRYSHVCVAEHVYDLTFEL